MATDNTIRLITVLASIQLCRADGPILYWYSSWYIWFAVTMLTTICCGVLGSYLRRRQIKKALRNQQSVILAIQRSERGGEQQVNQPLPLGVAYPAGVLPADGAAPIGQTFPSTAALYQPPPYELASSEKQSKLADLPPSYQEAVSSVGGYTNPAAVSDEHGQGPSTAAAAADSQLNTISQIVDETSQRQRVNSSRPDRV